MKNSGRRRSGTGTVRASSSAPVSGGAASSVLSVSSAGARLQRWTAWAIAAGLLLVLPLIFHRGFTEQFSYPKLILTEVLTTVGTTVWLLGLLWRRSGWQAGFRLGMPLALLSFAALLSCFNSPIPKFSLQEAEYFLAGPLWVLLLVAWIGKETGVRGVAVLATTAGALVAAIALLQWAGFDPLLFGGYQIEWGSMVARMRLYATFGNPNFVAGYLVGTFFLALALALVATRGYARAGWWLAVGLMLVAILGTGSRGAWAGLAGGWLVLVWVWKPRNTSARVEEERAMPTTFNGRCLAALPMVGLLAAPLGHRIGHLLLGRIEGRLFLWRASWPMFTEHPLFGSGWGTFQLSFLDLQARFLADHPALVRYWSNIRQLHNDPLELLLETGVVGFVAFVWVLVAYAREVQEVRATAFAPTTPFWLAASAGGVTAILLDSVFNFQFSIPPTLVLLFTLMAIPAVLKGDGGSDSERRAFFSDGPEQPLVGRMVSQLPARFSGLLPKRFPALVTSVAAIAVAGVMLNSIVRRARAEHDYALGLGQESRQEWSEAEGSYRRGLGANPLNGRLRFGLARALYTMGRYPEALRETLLAERTYADSHLEVLKARTLDFMGQGGQALSSYRRALALDPTLKTVQADISRLERKSTGQEAQ